MMNNDKITPDADGQDLTRLFDAQQDQVPEALDSLILAAAKEAVAEPAVTVEKRYGTAIKSGFAIAATLLLGITITPLLVRAPESALETTAPAGSTRKAVEESVAMTAESSVRMMQDSESDAADVASQDEVPMSITSPVVPAIQSQSRKAATRGHSLTQGTPLNEAKEYRRSAKNWLEQIRVLIEEEQPARAQTEYDLFRKAFPDYAPDFTLESVPE